MGERGEKEGDGHQRATQRPSGWGILSYLDCCGVYTNPHVMEIFSIKYTQMVSSKTGES